VQRYYYRHDLVGVNDLTKAAGSFVFFLSLLSELMNLAQLVVTHCQCCNRGILGTALQYSVTILKIGYILSKLRPFDPHIGRETSFVENPKLQSRENLSYVTPNDGMT